MNSSRDPKGPSGPLDRDIKADPLKGDTLIIHAMAGDETALRMPIESRFHSVTEFSPSEILFHSWGELRMIQGVGKELKEQKVVDHRPKESVLPCQTSTSSPPSALPSARLAPTSRSSQPTTLAVTHAPPF